MDLVSMVANDKKAMKLFYQHILKSSQHVYRSNWDPVIGEVLKTCMEPLNKVNKYAVVVIDDENNVTGHLSKVKSEKYAKTIFYFLKTDPLNICHVKITRNTVNLGDNKGITVPCLLQFTGDCKMMNILQEVIFKLKKRLF